MNRPARIARHVLTLLTFVATLTAAVALTAAAYRQIEAREVSYRYLADALPVMPRKRDPVDWAPPATPLARPVTEGDQNQIGRAIAQSWQVLAVAQEQGDTDLLQAGFSGVALNRARLSVADAQDGGGRMAVLAIEAQPSFFHRDGSVFQARVRMLVSRHLVQNDILTHHEVTRDEGIVTMMNESNGWRIYHYQRLSGQPVPDGTRPPRALPGRLDGLNYYPADTPWRQFWPNFDAARIRADFARIRDLGGRSVRIFLTWQDFAGDDPDKALRDLSRLLALARLERLQVIPTLFDLNPGYRTGNWAQDAQMLSRVVPILAGSDVVAMIDLKNEPDLDFVHHGEAQVEAWLRSMLAHVRWLAPDVPVTIGWSSADHALRLADLLDTISYHDYAPLAQTRAALDRVQAAADGKPVLVSEIGVTSFQIGRGWPSSPDRQARDLNTRLAALMNGPHPADGVLVWALSDFTHVDAGAVGSNPLIRRQQGAFGMLDHAGRPKPAAQILRHHFRGTLDGGPSSKE